MPRKQAPVARGPVPVTGPAPSRPKPDAGRHASPNGQRPADIETERLRLVVLLVDELRALLDFDTALASRLAQLRFPLAWPTDPEARDGLGWHLSQLAAHEDQSPWRVRAIVDRHGGQVIGSVNLKGPPDARGEVELGWGVERSHRQRGYAHEAAHAVLRWASAQPGVHWLIATISDENAPSQRLAAKLGLRRTGEERRGLPVWSRRRIAEP